MAAAPEALWILSARGEIFMRMGITVDLPEGGGGWSALNLSQLESEGAGRLRSVSLGSDAAWAVDEAGKVWMRLGSLCKASSPTAPVSAWIPVDHLGGGGERGDDCETPRFFRVAASASIHIVWALDERGRVYVRDGIFPDFRLGVGWVAAAGPDGDEEVVAISASEASVWALTRGGRAFARVGITPTNFIGDFWRPVPPPPSSTASGDGDSSGGLSMLSASACDSAFGADSSSVPMELREESVSLSVPNIAKYNAVGSPARIADDAGTEDGWTLITR